MSLSASPWFFCPPNYFLVTCKIRKCRNVLCICVPFVLVLFLIPLPIVAILISLSWSLSSTNIPSQVFPFTHPSFYLLSPCEYFTLLLPLVHDAGHWALIVCTQCGCCGMRPVGVRCVVTGVWLLTPASRLPVCLSVGSVTPDQWLHRCAHTHKHARPHMFIAALKMIPKIEVSDSTMICRPSNLHTHTCNFTSWGAGSLKLNH